MVLWKYTLREISSRPGRAVLTLLSIVIAVAAVVAVKVATVTTRHAYQEMYASLAGRAALEIVAEGGGTYDQQIVAQVEKVPGVKAAVPVLMQPTTLYHHNSPVQFLVMGIDPLRDEAVRDYELVEGDFFRNDDGALMEVGFARSLGVGVGSEVKLLTKQISQLRKNVPIVGLLAPKGAAQFNQGGTIFLTLRAAQRMFREPRSVNTTSLLLEESADPKVVQGALAAILPPGLMVRTPLARTQLGSETLQNLDQGLSFAYTMTLVLATIVILNTFLMNVSERRRQLAILRALGTTRGQIIGMLLREGLVMGLVGTAVGSVLGLAGAYGLSTAMAKAYNTSVTSLQLSPEPFLWALVLGPGMAVVAMFVPAHLAGKVTPLEGMRPIVAETSRPVSPVLTVLGVVSFLLTGGALAATVFGLLPIQMATAIGVLYTASLVLLIPAVLGPVSGLCAAALRPLFGTESQLAYRQIVRRRTRSSLTVGVLYVSLSAGIGLGTAILNNVQDVRNWQARTFVGDFFIRAFQPDIASGKAAVMPESLRDEFFAIPGVTGVDVLRFVQDVKANDQQVNAVLRDFTAGDRLPLDLKSGDPAEVRQRLAQGEVVLGTVLAHRLGVGVNDSITLGTRKGPQRMRVAGVTNEYIVGGLVVHLDRSVGKELLAADGADLFIVRAATNAVGKVETQLKAVCEKNGLLLHSFADLRRRLENLMNSVIAGLWGIIALGLVVAGFAVANTLTMNVLEQTREIAMLRVVAMTRRQVRKSILAQAAILGLFGVTFGVISGGFSAYTMNLCTPAVTGRPIDFALDWGLLAGTYLVALGITLLAAWLPARRAMQLNLLIALQYE